MKKPLRAEVNKLRELCLVLLAGRNCRFCRQPLLEAPPGFRAGEGTGPKIFALVSQLTTHHKNGDHDDDVPTNRTVCHRSCHKRFHLKERHRQSLARRAGSAGTAVDA